MKKFLLATSALSLFAASSAFAEGPSITLGGHANFQIGSVDQESVYEDQTAVRTYSRDVHTLTDTEIHVKVDGRTDSGLGYGAYIELEADVNADNAGGNNNSDRTFVYIESGFGRVEAGANGSASANLKVDASTFARAAGGIGGNYHQYLDLDGDGPTGATADTFIITPDLPTAGFPGQVASEVDLAGGLSTANKITYYSPRISGAQVGVSFTPDLQERGTAVGFSGETNAAAADTQIENIWNLGLNYQGEWKNIGVEASATGEWGSHESATRDDLQAFALGINLTYGGFTVGGSWADLNEFGEATSANTDGGFFTLGAAYEVGPFAASITYLDSDIDNADGLTTDTEFNNVSIGADYKLAPGLVPYVEVNFFETDDNISTAADDPDNDGTVILFGTALNF